MKKNIFYFLLIFVMNPFCIWAQPPDVASRDKEDQEKNRLIHLIENNSSDAETNTSLSHFIISGIDDIHSWLDKSGSMSQVEKEKANRSLVYLLQGLESNIQQRKTDVYEISGTFDSYRRILNAIQFHRPLLPLLKPLNARRTELMANSFTQYKENALIEDVAVYKRVTSSPQFILQFLEAKPNFRFADSLLLETATYDPLKIVYYLQKGKPVVQEMIRHSKFSYLHEIVSLANNKYASELLPFVKQIDGGELSTEEVLEKRTNPLEYFQLLINTLQGSGDLLDPHSVYLGNLRVGIKQKSLAFYVNEINDLHTSPETIRFASLKDLRPQDLYYLITSCGDELYTSSYLGLYKRLMSKFSDPDSLFDLVQNDNIRIFIRLAANYNVLGDFFHHLSPERMRSVLKFFIADIDSDEDSQVDRAMDIADAFSAIITDPVISDLAKDELEANRDRCRALHHYGAARLYSILLELLDLTQQPDGIKQLWTRLGNYEELKQDALVNSKGEVIQLVLFYGDEDGIASFNNFLRFYSNSKWKISKTENWVSVTSVSDQPLIIYANRPLDIKDELDLKAQDSLMAYLKLQGQEPVIIVHRGHSYHLDKTLTRLSPSVKLAILGSCGGYNKAISLSAINPDIQVIGSKKTGAMSINDPIINVIDENIVNKKDLYWPDIWKKLETRFSNDKTALGLFGEYFPPSNNLGLFVLKLYLL